MSDVEDKPAPLSPLEKAYRDGVCADLYDTVTDLIKHAEDVKAPLTDWQALVVGNALADLRKFVDTWRPK